MFTPPAPRTAHRVVRAVLWSLLVISVFGNSVASLGDPGLAVHLVFGLVSAVCAAALIADWRRSRA